MQDVIISADGLPMMQASIEAALAQDTVLDLAGQSWVVREQLMADGDIKIRNGRIDYRGPWGPDAETVALQINGTPRLVDFEIYRNGGINLVGIDIYDSFGAELDRVKVDHFKGGGCIGLRFTGGQRANVRSAILSRNDTPLVVRKGRTIATDLKFWGCGLSESSAYESSAAVQLSETSGVAFFGSAIETSRKGPLVLLDGCKNTQFGNVRFEGVGMLEPGEHSHIRLINGTKNTILSDNTTFNNTIQGADGTFPPVVSCDGSSGRTTTRNCAFPNGSPTHSGGMDIVDNGSEYFKGDKLAGLKRMFE